ncbi:MAG: hypothetical protein NVS3B11_15540 [Collimonas sp.]
MRRWRERDLFCRGGRAAGMGDSQEYLQLSDGETHRGPASVQDSNNNHCGRTRIRLDIYLNNRLIIQN